MAAILGHHIILAWAMAALFCRRRYGSGWRLGQIGASAESIRPFSAFSAGGASVDGELVLKVVSERSQPCSNVTESGGCASYPQLVCTNTSNMYPIIQRLRHKLKGVLEPVDDFG